MLMNATNLLRGIKHGERNGMEDGSMRSNQQWILNLSKLGLLLMMGASMSANAGLFGGESWKEEVLLHDGQKLIVERSQTRGGQHEIGQEMPIAEHRISFMLPNIHEAITWKSVYQSADTAYQSNSTNDLILLNLDIFNGVPYIVTTTTTCSSYNKWDRPNPPYVLFKYTGKVWQRISLSELPVEIREANVVIDMSKYAGTLSAKEVKRINEKDETDDVRYLRLFVREPIKNVVTACSKFE